MHALGEDDPNTLVTRYSLAHWQGAAGDPAGAADTLAELVKQTERVLGKDHKMTGTAQLVLAHWRGESKVPAEAKWERVKALGSMLETQGAIVNAERARSALSGIPRPTAQDRRDVSQ
ncbi:hypothetical protein AB0D57_19355 [Streptomyces sp. NPDC048275]|uniref:hypothetical protein n=1 Tax=Streptomyces sp. NPDC048275 TaxID=3155629 RepID=UPI0033FE7CC2